MNIDPVKEKKDILNKYRALLRKARPFITKEDVKKIREAFNFSLDAHKDMRRKSGEPYIYHPIEVARIVVEEIGLGATSIISALLHDVVEDTEYEVSDIKRRFGQKVANIVDGLTKISANSSKSSSNQAENFRKMLLTISKDIRVVLIKIADRLHNMRTLKSMPKDKQLKIKSETEYVYAPLAHRLGLYNIKSELEDLSLKYSDSEMYSFITKKLQLSESARKLFTKSFIKPIDSSLKSLSLDFNIKARTKSIKSIYNKMKKQKIPFEEIYDLFAIRIIFDSPKEEEKANCWKIYSIVTDFYTPNVNRLRDWVSVPKSNGYESLHTTVMGPKGKWVEVQIRSKRMDEVAEKGYAAHWMYKENKSVKKEKGVDVWLTQVRELLENNDVNAIDFIDDFRSNFFDEEVFIFTPKGDLKRYARGATVLDFAFDIHTEVGVACLGAKINGKLVPLNYELQSGDQVEILTSNKPKANDGWLKFVATSKAKSKIRDYLKEDKKKIAALGKEILQRKLKQIKVPLDDITSRKLVQYFNLSSETELYYNIGSEMIPHNEIKKFTEAALAENKEPKSTKEGKETPSAGRTHIKSIKKGENELIIGDKISNVDYSIASCCSPVPGDDIFGFITINSGIKIHRTSCPNAVALMASFGYRIIRARWAHQKDKEYEVSLSIEGTDRVGLVNDITKVISNQLQVNIKSISINANNSIFHGEISLIVKDRDEIKNLIDNLNSIDGILKITRKEKLISENNNFEELT